MALIAPDNVSAMATLVLTAIGDDRTGLLSALATEIAAQGGNWERSQMAELAGKFAGMVLVTVPDDRCDALLDRLAQLSSDGLLHITAERTENEQVGEAPMSRLSLELLGEDRTGIVARLSQELGKHNIRFEELRTRTIAAPMAGGTLFEAHAKIDIPNDVPLDAVQAATERVATELSVDITLRVDHGT